VYLRDAAPRRASAWISATCGELLQGVDDCGPILVSLPLRRAGRVEVALCKEPELRVTPWRDRAVSALRLALDACGWRGGADARLETGIPLGRGLGSSTVDVAGVITASFAAAGSELDEQTLLRLATAVEPSDSSPFAGLVAVDHVGGCRFERLGPAPTLRAVAVDVGAAIDTPSLHSRLGPGPELPRGALQRLASAIAAGDLSGIGREATESARRNQHRLPHPAFDVVLSTAAAIAAPGVCVAHSGTLAAVLCSDHEQALHAWVRLRAAGWDAIIHTVSAPGRRVAVQRSLAARGAPRWVAESCAQEAAGPPVGADGGAAVQ